MHSRNPGDRPFPGQAKKKKRKKKKNKQTNKHCPLVKFIAKVKELNIVKA